MKKAFRTIFLFLSLAGLEAHGDSLMKKYTVSTNCSADAPTGTQGAATIKNESGLLSKGASCQKTSPGFTRFDIPQVTGGNLRSNKVFGLQSGPLLIMPPIQTEEFQPIFTVKTGCPAEDQVVNWITVQWNDGAISLNNTYLFGTADISPNGIVTVRTQFDILGNLYWGGAVTLGSGRCDNGVTDAIGTNNLGGTLFLTPKEGGVFKSTPGKASFFLPTETFHPELIQNKVFQGITFDSSSSTDITDISNVQATVNATGLNISVRPYSDPELGTIDPASYTDAIALTQVNFPRAGVLLGTVTRTRTGLSCGGQPCQGRIVCIARVMGGSGQRLVCSGESPEDNSIPYNITLFRAYNCPEGYVQVPADNGSNVYENFCIAKYEMKNVGGTAASEPEGLPWVNLDRATAIAKCQELGAGYDLITDYEWQATARNIEDAYFAGKYVNWSNGSRSGANFLNRGHSDNAPAALLAASTDDNPCQGTGEVACNDPTSASWSQKRTHTLKNGKVIWDFAGNALEWVKDNMPLRQGGNNWASAQPWFPNTQNRWGSPTNFSTKDATSNFANLGYLSLDFSGNGLMRGGAYSQTGSGIYAAYLNWSPTLATPVLGFRCVYHSSPQIPYATVGFSEGAWAAGTVTSGSSATSPVITVANSGFGSATLQSALAVSGTGMSIVNANCPASGSALSAGAFCSFQVRFAPASPGAVSGTVTLNWISAGLSGAQTTVMNVSGTGAPQGISIYSGYNGTNRHVYERAAASIVSPFTVENGGARAFGLPASTAECDAGQAIAVNRCSYTSMFGGTVGQYIHSTCNLPSALYPTSVLESVGYVCGTARPGMVPLYRLYSYTTTDLVLTTDQNRANSLIAAGFMDWSALGWVPATPVYVYPSVPAAPTPTPSPGATVDCTTSAAIEDPAAVLNSTSQYDYVFVNNYPYVNQCCTRLNAFRAANPTATVTSDADCCANPGIASYQFEFFQGVSNDATSLAKLCNIAGYASGQVTKTWSNVSCYDNRTTQWNSSKKDFETVWACNNNNQIDGVRCTGKLVSSCITDKSWIFK